LAVDKVLHECVFAKTLDNITAVMIAFDNFENYATPETEYRNRNKSEYEIKGDPRNFKSRINLEPVLEDFIESEIESATEKPFEKAKTNI
jgi:hypothetical protein